MKKYHQEKSALLTVLIDQLDSVEYTLERIHALETSHAPQPDHDTLALQELIFDAADLAENLRKTYDAKATGGRP
jgi:hypothetical protein